MIEAAHWEDFKESYSADILIGFNAVYQKNSDNLTKARKNLLAFMKNSNPTEIAGFANMEYPTLGRSTRVRLIIEEAAKDNDKKESVKKSIIA